MLNNNSVGSRVLLRVFFAALFAVFGLSACGSGGGDSTSTNTTPAPAPSGIVLSLVPARTSGVAPLAVFFDASATTDTGVTTRPFHDLEYTWSFGDPNSGTWASGAQPGVSSKNSATGPVAAHVFETPGTYTVTLTAFDGANTATTNTTITVDNPDTVFAGTNTICVSSNTTPVAGANGCPTGATVVVQPSFTAAVNTYALTGKRVLFKRGDTFIAATPATIVQTGPGIVGAFGTGLAPKVLATDTVLNLSSSRTPDIKDWRIMDLDFDGQNRPSSIGIDTMGSIKQVLVLNMMIRDAGNGLLFNGSIPEWFYNRVGYPNHEIFDEMAVVDSTMTPVLNSTTGWRIYAAAKHFSIQGNTLGNMSNANSMGSHTVRITFMEKGVIANNTIARAGITQANIKLHAPVWCDVNSPPGTCDNPDNNGSMPPTYNPLTNTHPIGPMTATSGYSEQIVLSDNKIIGGNNPWTVTLGPQDRNNDERVRDVVVERNWFTSGAGTYIAVHVWSSKTTVRNNIFDLSGGAYHHGIDVTRWGGDSQVPPSDVRIYNNTFYRNSSVDAHNDFTAVNVDPIATDVRVINNLGSAPTSSTSGPVMVLGGCALNCSQSNNVFNASPSALFTSATPITPANFSLNSTSPARDAGFSTVPVFSDFFGISRPSGGAMDIGAIEGT